jgi:TM2 domain-containing membrane protein YozV
MKQTIIGISLFLLQVRLVFKEGDFIFNKYSNAVLLFMVSIAIPVYLIWLYLKPLAANSARKNVRPWNRIVWTIGALLIFLLSYEELRKIFVKFSDPVQISDVIPQLVALSERFFHGEFPYAPVQFSNYQAIPVYMPLHWLPIGLASLFHIDMRWIGFGFLAIVCAIYGWYMASQPGSAWIRWVALLLPSVPLWAFILWGPGDIAVSFELIIAAYYFLLTIGLLSRNYSMITLGIILCVLSRYTIVFWIPWFAIILFIESGWKKSLWIWGTVAMSIVILYIIPFYSKDPSFLGQQLTYYKNATWGDWTCCGENPISWTQEQGISFAPHMRALFGGDMAHRIYLTRVVMGIVLLLTFAGGLFAYTRWRKRIDFLTFSLVGLYVFIADYYFFGPLTYRYYLLPFLVLSAVLCGKIILHEKYHHKLT